MGVVSEFLIYISHSNIICKLRLLETHHQNSRVVLGATGMNGLEPHSEMKDEYMSTQGSVCG